MNFESFCFILGVVECDWTDGRHVMLPSGELHVLSVRNGDEAHFYHCRLLIRPNGQTMTSTTPGRLQLLTGRFMQSPTGGTCSSFIK